MIKVLIIEDEMKMRRLVSDYLKKEGYFVEEAADGNMGIKMFQELAYDLVILDVMMPEIDGWTVCRTIRESSKTPIIMLTARSEETDELFGFELGADEYITKPFSPKVLVARVKRLLKRVEGEKKERISIGNVVIDLDSRCVCVDEKHVDLTPKEFELFLYMAQNMNSALSREQILNKVWGYDYFGDDRIVDTNIKRLRSKLGNVDSIKTIRGYGYKIEVTT